MFFSTVLLRQNLAKRIQKAAVFTGLIGVVAGSLLCSPPIQAAAAVSNEQVIVATRRITETQYRNTIADVFSPAITINGRFEPEQRERMLLAIGSAQLSISAAGFSQYFAMARDIAAQAVAEDNREKYLSCSPAAADAKDDACTASIVKEYGRRLFRRPLTEADVSVRVALAAQGVETHGDFYHGVELALASLLSAPEFLFIVETAERDPKSEGDYRLNGYSRASRLSHLFWDSAPDEALLQAAAKGELHTQKGVTKQVERLMASPRFEQGARAFFSDILHLDRYANMTKDTQIYPKFSQMVADSAKEQTLKTVVHHLLENDGDYRELLTTRDTFMNRSLAAVYEIPFLADEGWMKYSFPEDSHQSGLLTQISMVGIFAHPGRSSPVLRGVGVNEIFLCSPTPLPPANVDFSIINDTDNPRLNTSRLRLEAHAEDPACSGCHRMIDPLGLALDNFDALGQPQFFEDGQIIDVSVQLFGVGFDGARGLGKYLYESEKVQACLVQHIYGYGIGREPTTTEKTGFLAQQTAAFARSGYKFRSLLKAIATSEQFFNIDTLPADVQVGHVAEAR